MEISEIMEIKHPGQQENHHWELGVKEYAGWYFWGYSATANVLVWPPTMPTHVLWSARAHA